MFDTSPATPSVRFAQGMGLLDEAFDVLGGVDVADVPAECLDGYVLGLVRNSRRFGAVQAAVTDRFSTSGGYVHAAAKSARAWVASQTTESPARVGQMIDTGRNMRAHPLMAHAFIDGEVSARHVDILATTAARFPAAREHLERCAEAIVDVARMTTATRFGEHLRALCHTVDPAGVEDDQRNRDGEAFLHLSKIGDGMWRLDGLLPDEVGAHFKAVLESVRRKLRAEAKQNIADSGAADTSEEQSSNDEAGNHAESVVIGIDVLGQPIYGDETPAGAMDHRVGSKQNVDALRLILNLVAPATNPDGTIALPSVGGARPVVHLTVPIESLLDDTRSKAAAWLERFGVPDTVISATKAELLTCDSTIEPLIVRDGKLVASLPSLQTVPAHLRKAVLMRDQQCRINSCISPIDEVHHLIFLSRGGQTTMSNLAGLCWFHHHMIHREQWTLSGDANHELLLTNTTTGQQWLNRPPPNLRC